MAGTRGVGGGDIKTNVHRFNAVIVVVMAAKSAPQLSARVLLTWLGDFPPIRDPAHLAAASPRRCCSRFLLAAWQWGRGWVEVPSRSLPPPTDGMFVMAAAVIATS